MTRAQAWCWARHAGNADEVRRVDRQWRTVRWAIWVVGTLALYALAAVL